MNAGESLDLPTDAISGYQLTHKISQGQHGSIYHAIQLSVQREIALKVLTLELSEDATFRDAFLREARNASATQHPHIISCFDAGITDDGMCWQALEYLPGGNLADLLLSKGEALDSQESIAIGLDCTRGLEALHSSGVAHRDINPSNIMLDSNGNAKIVDFGMAKTLLASNLSQLQHNIEELPYVAPEIINGANGDIRSDIYAIGAVLFHCITGTAPFTAQNEEEQSWEFDDDLINDPRAINPDCPAGLAAVIRKALEHDLADRYQTPTRLREDLERLSLDFAPLYARASASDSGIRRETRSVTRAATKDSSDIVTQRTERTQRPNRRNQAVTPVKRDKTITYLMAIVVLLIAAGGGAAAVFFTQQQPSATRTPQATAPTTTAPAPAAATPTEPAATQPLPPTWAHEHGSDKHGRWAKLLINNMPVTFRYCPPGTFTMGSESGEPGRRADEILHKVTSAMVSGWPKQKLLKRSTKTSWAQTPLNLLRTINQSKQLIGIRRSHSAIQSVSPTTSLCAYQLNQNGNMPAAQEKMGHTLLLKKLVGGVIILAALHTL